MNAVVETTSNKPALERHAHSSVALAAVPKYFPDSLDLPLDPDHKTWHTERRCPTLLAQALGSERLAIFIAQLHYWLEKEDVGVYKYGFHWIYNAEWEWREQFPWMSEHTMGRVRRKLERLGYVVSNDFNRNPLDRTKHSTLDYYRLALETGWNPMGLDLNRKYPHPPQFTKGINLRGRHKSDSVPLVYSPVEPDEPSSLKRPKSVDSATLQNASCTIDTMHSAQLPVSSIYKEIPNTSKSNQETNLKFKPREGNQNEASLKLFGKENEGDTQLIGGLLAANSQLSESSSPDECSAHSSLDNDVKIKVSQQFLASLNAEAEIAQANRSQVHESKRPIRISGLDESAHEVLWKHSEQLEKLNADLYAERIQKAIVDNPQHLEDAILTFIENSANGAKTPLAATGFLYNALRQGWKPRQTSSSANVSVQVYTPPPQMLEPPTPPSLSELVESKRAAWQNAPILRSHIEAWVKQTRGVVMTADGPALESATNQPSQIDSEPLAASPQVIPAAESNPPQDAVASPKPDPLTQSEVEPNQEFKSVPPQPAVNSKDNVASNPTPPLQAAAASAAFVLPTEPSPSKPPIALQKPPSNRRLQPVEILTSAGEWIAGYFVHSCIAVANLVGQERQFTLFNADGQMCCFWGQIRPTALSALV